MSAETPVTTIHGSTSTASPMARRVVMCCAIGGLLWLLIARILGPTDCWDHTQPKTLSYTTDIIVHGRWVLPIERGEFPATKPPLYNWLAAPAVAVFGFNNEWAHKLPSMVALILCFAATVWVGSRIDRSHGGLVGWMAGLGIVSTQMFFKLGYLARPDMVLTLWLVLGWMACTSALVSDDLPAHRRRLHALAFWLCVALAGMTKGPAALVLVVFGLIGGKLVNGSWRTTGRLCWSWGLPLALLINAAWLFAVWRVDPDHLLGTLWYDEIYGRITGEGPEGASPDAGPWYPIISLTYMPHYFVSRLLPWSVIAILGMVHLWRKNLSPGERNWRALKHEGGVWYHSAAVFIIVTVAIFSLSTGKRADYVAAAVTPACLLSAWWLLRVRPDVSRWSPRLAPFAAAIALTALTIDNQLQPLAPSRTYGEQIQRFIDDAEQAIHARPLPVLFYHAGNSHMQAFLGQSQVDSVEPLEAQLAGAQAFWLIEGPLPTDAPRFEQLANAAPVRWTRREVVVSDPEFVAGTWPGRTALWRVEPRGE